MATAMLATARAEALFLAPVCCTDPLTREGATAAIREVVRSHGGTRSCAAHVAAEYGDHPDTAPARMTWALGTVNSLYPNGVHR